jgi:hypothetical protein
MAEPIFSRIFEPQGPSVLEQHVERVLGLLEDLAADAGLKAGWDETTQDVADKFEWGKAHAYAEAAGQLRGITHGEAIKRTP